MHVVVKNQPFLVQVGMSSNSSLEAQAFDFKKASLEARLLYDCDQLKEVDFVKLKPLEYKCHASDFDRGDQITVELKLKVLSSQLEDMFFRIRFTALHPVTKQPVPSLTVVSEPIKVVSKPDQVRKKKSSSSVSSQPPPTTSQNSAPTPSAVEKRKRTAEEMVVECLSRIENKFMQQKALIAKVADLQKHEHEEFQKLMVSTFSLSFVVCLSYARCLSSINVSRPDNSLHQNLNQKLLTMLSTWIPLLSKCAILLRLPSVAVNSTK